MRIFKIINRVEPRWQRKSSFLSQLVNKNKSKQIVEENLALAQKQKAVLNYIENKDLNVKSEDCKKPTYYNLSYKNIDDCIEELNGNLDEISSQYGIYGLAYHAQLEPEKLIKNKNADIIENGYKADKSFSYSFTEYIMENKKGNLNDLYSRFGKAGEYMYKHYSALGFTKTGFYSYNLSPRGESHLRLKLASDRVSKSLDTIKEVLV